MNWWHSNSDLVRINREQMFTLQCVVYTRKRRRRRWRRRRRQGVEEGERNISYVDGVVDVLLVTVENVQADGEGLDAALSSAMASLFCFLLLLLLLFLFLLLLLFVVIGVLLFAFLLFQHTKIISINQMNQIILFKKWPLVIVSDKPCRDLQSFPD